MSHCGRKYRNHHKGSEGEADSSLETGRFPVRYPQNAEQSAELLRLIIPRIGQHGGCFHPPSYTVWYEHLVGMNPALSDAIESRLSQGTSLAQTEIDELHARHVQSRDRRNVVELQAGLSALLRKLAQVATQSGADATMYSRVLAECEHDLESIVSAEGLRELTQSLLTSTATARASTEAMCAEVEEARSQMQRLHAQLDVLQGEAFLDPLTGLRNRRGFERACEELFAGTVSAPSDASLILIDIDHFKKLNDTYGHLFGDQVLRTAAKVIAETVKGRDVVARFGGDEFLLLLPDTAFEGALALAENIRAAFGRMRIRRTGGDSSSEQVSISLGIAAPAPAENVDQLIERADRSLYRAKAEGRNCVRHLPDNAESASARLERH
jgi:diguanylate cyclase